MSRFLVLFLLTVCRVAMADSVAIGDSFTQMNLAGKLPTTIVADTRNAAEMYEYKGFTPELYDQSVAPNAFESWYKIRIHSQQLAHSKSLVLVSENHLLQQFDVHLFRNGALERTEQLGTNGRPESQGVYQGANFEFVLAPNDAVTLLLRKKTDGPGILPLSLMEQEAFSNQQAKILFLWGGAVCVMVVLFIYNAFVFSLNRRNKQYVWYLVFQLLMFLHFAPLHGFGYIIFPDAVCRWLGNHLGFIHLLLLWSAMLFSYHFLDIGRFRPRLAYGIKKSYFLFIPLIILSVFMTELQRMYVTAPLTIGVLYICIGSAIHEIKKGYYPATYYSLSWVGISLGAICGYLTYIDVIPQNIFTMHSFMIGSIAEQLLLSVSLAKRLQYQEGKIKLSHLIDQTLDMPNQNFNQQELKEQFVRSNRDPSSVRLLLIQLEGLDDVIGTLGTDIVAQENRVILQNVADAVSSLPWQIDLHLDKPYFGLCIPPHQTLVFVTNEESCKVQIEKLMAIWQQEIDESFYLSDVNIRAASADLTKGWDEISRLHQCAYMALVEARNNGEKWLPYTQSMMESSQKHITLLQDLKLAISDNDIEVYIQPQVDLSSNEVVGGEALVRWTHPRLGGVSPGVFIPLAEQSGLIYSLTQSVIRQLFSWVVNQPPTLNFSVNISALDVQQKGFVSFLQQMRDHYGVNAKNITLEITESKEMDLSHDFIGKLKAMKSLGFSLSIDDFGTGYSSLAYLSQLDIDEVKVDIMFTRDIDKNVTNQNIVKTLINMADAFQANVVIEGIETINERRMVKSLGGGIGQGFFWSGAVPMRKFEQQFSRTQCEVEVNQQQGLAYLHR